MGDGIVGTVKVKPMVWFEVYQGRLGGKYTADGYTIQWIEGLWLLYFAGESKSAWRFTDIESAKAAAQADYEARVIDALDVQPITVQDAAKVPEIAALIDAMKPFADIGVSENPDFHPIIRMDRDAIIAARAALRAIADND